MAGYKLLKRLDVILHLVETYPYISKSELIQRLADDYNIVTTKRTIERDFRALSLDFGIELTYCTTRNGYKLSQKDEHRIQSFLRYVELVHVGELFKQGLNDFDVLRQTIALEDSSKFKGIHLIKPLLLAVKQSQSVNFIYENYSRETHHNYKITPLQIREYQNRWYVIGVPEGETHIRTFGLDRISDLELSEYSTIKISEFETQLDKFNNVVGLNYNATEKKEFIRIAVTEKQYKYLRSLPLHQSQTLEKELDDQRLEVSFYLKPNFEFKMHILKMGSRVEVLSPDWLREEIKTELQNSLKQYKS